LSRSPDHEITGSPDLAPRPLLLLASILIRLGVAATHELDDVRVCRTRQPRVAGCDERSVHWFLHPRGKVVSIDARVVIAAGHPIAGPALPPFGAAAVAV